MERKLGRLMVLILAVAFGWAGGVSQGDITTGLILHYKLDDGSGTSALDSSVNGYNGTVNGTVSWESANVAVGTGAYNFVPSDRYIDSTKNASTLGIGGNQAKSVSCWVYTRSFNNGGPFDMGNYGTRQNFSLRTYTQDTWRIQYWGDDSDFTLSNLNEWTHFVLVYNGSGNTKCYANGLEIVNWDHDSLSTADTTNFEVGRWHGSDWFDGIVDDVRVYDRVLSADDVWELALLFSGNLSPIVDAGALQQVEWAQQDWAKLDAAVKDDNIPSAAVLTWSKVSGPGTVSFLPSANVEDPCAVFSAPGVYVLNLNANDTEFSVDDTVDIRVHVPAMDVMVAYWDLEENTGTSVTDQAAGNNGVFIGKEPNWVPGWIDYGLPPTSNNSALEFYYVGDNTGSAVKITANENADPNFNNLDYEVSVSAWFRVNAWNNIDWQTVVARGDRSWRLARYASTDRMAFHFTGEGGVNSGVDGTISINDGEWHHAVGTYSVIDKVGRLYIDGVLDNTVSFDRKLQIREDVGPQENAPVTIGANSRWVDIDPDEVYVNWQWQTYRSWNGRIDDVRIYSYALDAAEVTALYLMGNKNDKPVVDAGDDQIIIGGAGPYIANLDGDVIDNFTPWMGGLVTTWSETAGPGTVTFGDAGAVDTTAEFSQTGVYTLQLHATDGEREDADTVWIKVKATTEDGAVAYWKLDNDPCDSIGGHHGTVVLGDPCTTAGWIANGAVNEAIDLVGGDHIYVGTSTDFDITSAITVVAWFKVDDFNQDWQTIISKGDDSWRLARNGSNHALEFACSGLTNLNVVSNKLINDNQWHFAAGVYDGATLKMYIDGQLDNTVNSSGQIAVSTNPVLIGGQEHNGQLRRQWDGKIDEVRVYNQALVSSEIEELFWKSCLAYHLTSQGLPGDTNFDCKVNLLDFADLAADWLRCQIVTDPACN